MADNYQRESERVKLGVNSKGKGNRKQESEIRRTNLNCFNIGFMTISLMTFPYL